MKAILLVIGLISASPVAAQENCICLKCVFGQHRLVQATSQNMAPALEPGDCRYARYLNEDFDRLQYGDMIFFQHPVIDGEYLNRIVAMGGDTIQMVDGKIWLNGQPLKQEKIEDYEILYEPMGPDRGIPMCQNRPEIGGICRTERYTEIMPNGKSYDILNVRDSRMDNTEVFNVPVGFVFVLGDHRDNSVDSRFPQSGPFRGVGFVPLENIIGIIEEN